MLTSKAWPGDNFEQQTIAQTSPRAKQTQNNEIKRALMRCHCKDVDLGEAGQWTKQAA